MERKSERSASEQGGRDAPERERKSARTRRRILDAAADVLNRKGYAGRDSPR